MRITARSPASLWRARSMRAVRTPSASGGLTSPPDRAGFQTRSSAGSPVVGFGREFEHIGVDAEIILGHEVEHHLALGVAFRLGGQAHNRGFVVDHRQAQRSRSAPERMTISPLVLGLQRDQAHIFRQGFDFRLRACDARFRRRPTMRAATVEPSTISASRRSRR
jgi:hypothetical protein